MNPSLAQKLNAAACRIWLFQHGACNRLDRDDVAVVRAVTGAQIQSAAEVIEALNRDAGERVGGGKTIQCTLEANAAEQVKAYADSLPDEPRSEEEASGLP